METSSEVSIGRKRKLKVHKSDYKKRKETSDMIDEEEERLEKLVLGNSSTLLKALHGDDSGVEDEVQSDEQYSDTLATPPREPAWVDEDDLELTVEGAQESKRCLHQQKGGPRMDSDFFSSLRAKFETVYGPSPSWAKLEKPIEMDEDDSILRRCGSMMTKSTYLPRSTLDFKQLSSLNSDTRNEGPVVKAVEFHPWSTVGLVAGLSGVASVIQVDGEGNKKLASVKFDKFPIRCAKFSRDGEQFFVGSQHHSHFYSYDMMSGQTMRFALHHNMELTAMKNFEVSPDGKFIVVCGKFGKIHLLTSTSKEWIGSLNMNGNVSSIAMTPDSSFLYSHGEQGEVYVWDLERRCCIHKFRDEGCLSGTSLAISPCGSLLAAGSSSGVVNVYDVPSLERTSTPTPMKALMNIVTPVTSLKFNHSSQILAMASDDSHNAVKLVHFPSMTVFSNFPPLGSNLKRVQTVNFSPQSGFLSIANNKSTAYLYRLRHFGNY